MSRDPGCIAGPCMYRDRYFEIEKLLDETLGSEDTDGAGEGIVADIRLALAAAEKRGALNALHWLKLEHRDWAYAIDDLARRIESGRVTP